MTMLLRRIAPVALLAVALMACGTAASPPPSSPPLGSSILPSQSPTPDASEPAPSGPDASGPGFPAIDFGDAATALEGIDSYRMKIEMEGTTAATFDAIVVRAPEDARDITITTSGATQRFVVIGAEAWMDAGTGTLTSIPASMATQLTNAFDPVLLVGMFNGAAYTSGMERVGDEEKNGVQATHYLFDADTAQVPGASFPPGGSMDIWIAEAGYLVSFEARGMAAGTSLIRVDVSNINDAANVVERPD